MKSYDCYLMVFINCVLLLIIGCAVSEKPANRNAPFGLITTPPSYYSTPKARYLGDRYRENLDRIVERIVRNAQTSSLQFANNISTVGGIGFFTHSATSTADERYLEVVVGVPETFEAQGEQSAKVLRLFSNYGAELLSILSADSAIYQEREVAGYGLNFSWRNVVPGPSGSRVILERAIVYAPKEKVRSFLRQEINQNGLLGEAVIFAAEENAPLRLVSYRAAEPTPNYRPPSVQEETIVARREAPKVAPKGMASAAQLSRSREVKAERPAAKDATPSALGPSVSPVSASAPQTDKMEPSNSPEKAAKRVEEPVGSAEPKTKDVSRNQATREPWLKEAAPASGVLNPAKEMKREGKETAESTSVAKIAEPAVKPPFEKRSDGTPSVISIVEGGSPPSSNRLTPTMAESVKTEKAVESKSPAPTLAKEKSAESLVPSGVKQDEQPRAEPVSSKVEATAQAPQLPSPVNQKSKHNQPTESQSSQQIALKRDSGPQSVVASAQGSPVSRSLEGYIVQLSFADKVEARRWAETLERRGHTVSMTEPGGGGSIRVRIGNFSQRTEAERQLQKLRQDGLVGIVLNLPQAYRPEVHPQARDGVTKTGTLVP